MAYLIRQLTDNDFENLYVLHTSVYGKNIDKQHYKLKYATFYCALRNTGFIAFDNKKPIGFLGMIPCYFNLDEKKILASSYCDAITHPDYQSRGVFRDLMELVFETAKALYLLLRYRRHQLYVRATRHGFGRVHDYCIGARFGQTTF